MGSHHCAQSGLCLPAVLYLACRGRLEWGRQAAQSSLALSGL